MLEKKFSKLKKFLDSPDVGIVSSDLSRLFKKVKFTSELAESISAKVRTLDVARKRVQQTAKRVDDVIGLRSCTDGVQSAMQNEEYEKAAAHIHRYLAIDESTLLQSADEIGQQSGGGSLADSFRLLKNAERRLKSIVDSRFDEAVAHGDVASVERFFKIFPLLNQHDHGLKKYSVSLCSQVRYRIFGCYFRFRNRMAFPGFA